MNQKDERPDTFEKKKGLGTFGGVFTPSVLTILGIILFMRLGFVVGSAGLKQALLIIALANVISILTSVSLSAIATNLKVKGGGDYYLISRTLGLPFGGAIGIVLFLAQSVSIAFYCIGFGEAMSAMLPDAALAHPQLIAAVAAAFLFVFAWLGADWATRFQYGVMAALVVSLASFFIGGLARFDGATLAQNWDAAPIEGFWFLFAIFFPAVTGFTQGVSMSGDLKDPGRSLPLGTFLAVGISVVVYFGAALVFAGGLPAADLLDYEAMKHVSAVGWLISVGVISATLSSAMASFLGAPRILQSLSKDRIFPFLKPFAKGAGPMENPRRGVLLSAVIAFAVIGLGRLNVVAPVVSMFFLISYGLLNYATFFEGRAASPSFRPRFRWFHYRVSFVGSAACLAAMVAINLTASVVAVSILLAIHQYLRRTAGPARWADSRRSHHFRLLREHLFALTEEPEHPRDWTPRLLVFSKDRHRREQLLRFAAWLEGGSGLTTAVQILEGDGAKVGKLRAEAEEEMRKHIKELGLEALSLAVSAPDLLTGARVLIQSHGLGPVKDNTIVLNWIEQRPSADETFQEQRYGRYLQTAIRLGCNVVVLDTDTEEWAAIQDLPPEGRRIDVWWWDNPSGRLMLLLAYLMTRSEAWRGARIRVLAFSEKAGDSGSAPKPDSSKEPDSTRNSDVTAKPGSTGKPDAASDPDSTLEADVTRAKLEEILTEGRIEAEPVVLGKEDPDTMVEQSKDASLVFLPLRIVRYQPVDPFGERLEDLFKRLPVVAMALAAQDIALDAEPEEGPSGEAASKVDAAEDLKAKAEEAERAAAKTSEKLEKVQGKVEKLAGPEGDEAKRLEAEKELADLEEQAERAARKAAKARAKAKDAAKEAGGKGNRQPEAATVSPAGSPPACRGNNPMIWK